MELFHQEYQAVTYRPKPIDTSEVILGADHLKLTELLAKNTHELWAQQRLGEGWQTGNQRDDGRKEHPCLIPYEDLPESEKEYDRITALGVIKTLLALGYRIEGQDMASAKPSTDEDRQLAVMLQSLENSSELNLPSLLALQRETIKIQPHTPDLHHAIGDQILKLGEPLIAYDVLAEGLKQWPHDVGLQQKLALALARSGATGRANALLGELLASGHQDEETLGLLARTHKDLWLEARDLPEKKHQLSLAAQRYEQAYQLSGSPWTGINAATMAIFRGQEDKAQAIATEVRQKCLQKLESKKPQTGDNYWTLATLGEAALILKSCSEAQDWYSQAAAVGQGRFGDLSSSRRNATILMKHLGQDLSQLQQWFNLPRVAVFSGHVIDQPGREVPRFPSHIESQVYHAIRDRLSQLNASLGYASAAYGADILFLEAILELKGEIHVVLPYEREEFIKNAVDVLPNANWVQRFDRVLSQATEVMTASKRKLEENDVVYEYASRLLHGLAKIRAAQLDTQLVPLAVWDGKPSNSLGGTATAVANWRTWGYDVEIIDLNQIVPKKSITLSTPSPPPKENQSDHFSRQIMALLFADVVKYSHLREEQISPFVQYFLGAVAQLERESEYKPVMKNTWGDALYFVFGDVRVAGNFALELCNLVHHENWAAKGLPKDLNLRIALHAGPVYKYTNPITKVTSYIGTHVSHAARIEPITPPGKVYASQPFAALASSASVTDFSCDYVGQTPLAKGYGTFPTYHVRRCISE